LPRVLRVLRVLRSDNVATVAPSPRLLRLRDAPPVARIARVTLLREEILELFALRAEEPLQPLDRRPLLFEQGQDVHEGLDDLLEEREVLRIQHRLRSLDELVDPLRAHVDSLGLGGLSAHGSLPRISRQRRESG